MGSHKQGAALLWTHFAVVSLKYLLAIFYSDPVFLTGASLKHQVTNERRLAPSVRYSLSLQQGASARRRPGSPVY